MHQDGHERAATDRRNEHVEPARDPARLRQRFLHIEGIAGVSEMRFDLCIGQARTQRLLGCLQRLGAAIHQEDRGSVLQEIAGCSPRDAAATAGDKRDLALEHPASHRPCLSLPASRARLANDFRG